MVSGATDVMLTDEDRDSAEGRGSERVEVIRGGVGEEVKDIPVDRLDMEVADGRGGGGVVDAETDDRGGVARAGIGGKLDKAGRLDKVAKELVVMVAEDEEDEEEGAAEEEGEEEEVGGTEEEEEADVAEAEPEPDDVEAEGCKGDELEEVQGALDVVVVVVVEGVDEVSAGGVKQAEDNREDVVVRVIVVETSEVVEA